MKLSQQTIKTIKTFSSINSSLVIRPGKHLRTITEAKTIMAAAEVEEEFQVTAGIYDLPEFLGTLGLFKDPELEWSEHSVVISEGGTKVEYAFCDPDMVTSIEKDPKFPEGEDSVTFDITRAQLGQIMKGANTLNLSDIRVYRRDNGDVVMAAADSKNVTDNTIEVVVGHDDREVDYQSTFAVENIRLNSEYDYQVTVSFKGISRWTATNSPLPLTVYIGSAQNPKSSFSEK